MEELSTEEIRKTFQNFVDITLCAICLETVRPDMIQCVNGHLLCTECLGDLYDCPTCRDNFSPVKPSGFISQVVEALPPRCKYKNCGKYLKSNEPHEKYCGLKLAPCKFDDCNWNGPGKDILDHIRQQHPEEHVINETNNGSLIFTLRDFDPNQNQRYFKPISMKGQFLWLEIENDIDKRLLIHKFHFVATNEKPKNDVFCKVFYTSDEMKFMSKIKLNTDPDVSTEELNYISIPKFMLQSFVDEENKLNSNFYIRPKFSNSKE